jgi:cysteine desulfurase/selenocysteine lyase
LGTIVPLTKIIEWAHANDTLVAVDGAQSVPHMPVDLTTLGCDFFSFSAHKMLGPTGVGVLWAKEELLEKMNPFMGGGEMIDSVSLEKTTWAELPHKFEAGTPNFADVAAFSAALDYLTALGMDAVRQHEKEMVQYALKRLESLPELIIYGPRNADKQGGVVSFNHVKIHAHDVGTILNDEGVAVRVGHHCAQPLMKTLGVPGTVRASFYIYNTLAEVDALVNALARVDEVFGFKPAKRK